MEWSGEQQATTRSAQSKLCGIGIVLSRRENDLVYVQGISLGGSAHVQKGVVQVGDRLLAAQGLDVGRMSTLFEWGVSETALDSRIP